MRSARKYLQLLCEDVRHYFGCNVVVIIIDSTPGFRKHRTYVTRICLTLSHHTVSVYQWCLPYELPVRNNFFLKSSILSHTLLSVRPHSLVRKDWSRGFGSVSGNKWLQWGRA